MRTIAARLSRAIDRVLAGLLAVVLAALLVLVFGATLLRYLFSTGFVATEDLGILLHTALVFLGLPLCASGPLAMRIDVATRRLGPRARAIADVASDAITLAAALVLTLGAGKVAALIGGTSPTLGIPESWRFWPVAIGGGLAAGQVVLKSVAGSRSWLTALTVAGGMSLAALPHLPVLVPVVSPSLIACLAACLALAAGAPFVHSLLVGLAVAVPFGARLPEAAIVQQTVSGMGKFLLLAIPFFLLAGMLMNAGGLAHRLVRFASALVGHRRGGMAQATLVTNLMFSGVSGSSIADAAFGAKVLAPALVDDGVKPEKAAAIVAATAVLPNIIPPSIAFLLLASATNLSVGALFEGGLVAGLILAAAMAVMLHFATETPTRPIVHRVERLAAFTAAIPVFGLALVVFLGIRLGIATPTEAAAVASVYALIAAVVGPGGRRSTRAAFLQAGRETAAIGLLVASSAPLVFLLAIDGLPQALAGWVTALGGNPLAIMLIANLILLVVGGPLDVGPGILLFAPLLLPSVTAAGIDPVAFGVILTINLMIGGLTPPVGVLVFVAAGITGLSASAVFRAALPLTLTLVAATSAMALVVALWALV
ncbi:ABC transporter permease [Pleomorphomonas diazotrophica]|uniref:ABC transporter permease n=1 Tax=Pleomorphomonas diazotrophica TaxID=1166257 RepID=A0A1I4QIP3_9HYPH|nr:TRAP transporter large permease subunit [Pleomorphomonas diazotrophica]PKR90630.1 ABC transporter permease [Pleomorphomonas diazotrophica]SFM39931.1 TRAP transporter, DctM subunit [Pleomorphomonas diazotrophica]